MESFKQVVSVRVMLVLVCRALPYHRSADLIVKMILTLHGLLLAPTSEGEYEFSRL